MERGLRRETSILEGNDLIDNGIKKLEKIYKLIELGRAIRLVFENGYDICEYRVDYDWDENAISAYKSIICDEESLLKWYKEQSDDKMK